MKARSPHRPRKPYRPPRLVTHGNLRHLTMTKGGLAADGLGKPRTKVTGVNA